MAKGMQYVSINILYFFIWSPSLCTSTYYICTQFWVFLLQYLTIFANIKCLHDTPSKHDTITQFCVNVASRLRRWSNISPALGWCIVFAGMPCKMLYLSYHQVWPWRITPHKAPQVWQSRAQCQGEILQGQWHTTKILRWSMLVQLHHYFIPPNTTCKHKTFV